MKKSLLIIFLIVMLLAGGGIYWYQIRPQQIRSTCNQLAEQKAKALEIAKFQFMKNEFSKDKNTAGNNFIKSIGTSYLGKYDKSDYNAAYTSCLQQKII